MQAVPQFGHVGWAGAFELRGAHEMPRFQRPLGIEKSNETQ